MNIKREEVFEVHEPPAHGLTRLRARMLERKTSHVLRPVLALAVVATAVALVVWPREVPRVDFSASVSAMNTMQGEVMALGETAIEPMQSTNPRVVMVRVMATAGSPSP